ncbi:plant cysteine oxidase 2-like [Iris pallida]|uniref:cysteine dioxygenase n=1 Tax=Iris pallida TaxID=29817 RepID=A0AAX6EW68_IRIPA|nr:plant cysteine oxidase 2-like [Iris pallida]KAJ6812820.1 plant cysteine oxidase 2-like [Iris pallida]
MRVGEKLAELASSKTGKRKQKRSSSSEPPMPCRVVQRLFDTCMEVFADCGPGVVPSPENIHRLRSVLDNMKPADVGLSPRQPYFKTVESRGAPPTITYLHLYECPKFSIGIFCLPKSAVIPLHNHPGMTVFSKLLFGSMHIKSYDWIDSTESTDEMIKPSHLEGRNLKLAKLKADTVFTAPCETSILYPAAGGNMHCFTAVTACAVLDVLGPPYNDSEKRHCTYYNDFPCTTVLGDSASVPDEGEKYAWLEEREKKPNNFSVVGAKYKGPRIVER